MANIHSPYCAIVKLMKKKKTFQTQKKKIPQQQHQQNTLASLRPKLSTANINAMLNRIVNERKINAVGSNVYPPSGVRAIRTSIVHEKLAITYESNDNGPNTFESNMKSKKTQRCTKNISSFSVQTQSRSLFGIPAASSCSSSVSVSRVSDWNWITLSQQRLVTRHARHRSRANAERHV
jgi:hypothetical protein